MKHITSKLAATALVAASIMTAQPSYALGEFVELKIHTLQCAGILVSDIVNGTSIHPDECGTGGTATSNYGGHTSGVSKCYEYGSDSLASLRDIRRCMIRE